MHKKPSRRHYTRQLSLQALYAWYLTGNNIDTVLTDTIVEWDTECPVDVDMYQALVKQVVQNITEIDAIFAEYLDREMDKLTPIELAILRLSTSELLYNINVPYKIVINEGIELAKAFGAQDSHKFINGVLDKAAKVVRAAEQ